MKKYSVAAALSLFFCLAIVFPFHNAQCQEAASPTTTIALIAPDQQGGKPLMQAIKSRQSQRDFKPDMLTDQQLSNLLWATAGINRPDSGMRTTPSACNFQEIDVYVAMAHGTYKYDPKAHALVQISTDDVRGSAGKQSFVADAPLVFIFVADFKRMDMDIDSKKFYSATDTGFMSQNAYLYCASEGLATVVLGWVDKEDLKKVLGLSEDQHVILTQPVGNPK